MAINKSLPVTATVITRRVDPGFYAKRVGQTLSNPTSVQWKDGDNNNIGSPSRFLLLTSDLAYRTVKPGVGGVEVLVLPEAATLNKSTDQTPATNRVFSTNRSGFNDYDPSRALLDWMKSARIECYYNGLLQTALNGVSTSVVVQSAIPSDMPPTGTLVMGAAGSIPYTSYTGSTFTIPSTDFTSTPLSMGAAVNSTPTVEALRTNGCLDSNYWPTKTPNFAPAGLPYWWFLWTNVTPEWENEYFDITWTGTGTILAGGNFSTISSGSNTLRVRLPATLDAGGENCWLYVGGQVSNVTIIPDRDAAGYAAGDRFRPELLEFYSATRLVRMMDWGRTNASPIEDWADRALESHAVYTNDAGLPLEVMLDFAVEAGCPEIWFCVPHKATNAYITSFGQWLDANIPVGITPYVELGNEIWNYAFQQTLDYDAIGLADWGVNFKHRNVYGKRAAEMFHLIGLEYSGPIVRVCGVQVASTTTTTDALVAPLWLSEDAYYSASLGITMNAPHTYFDAIAVTNYFYAELDQAEVITAMRAAFAISEDEGHQWIFNKLMEAGTGLQETDGYLQAQRAIADTYSKRLIGYEGGNHMVTHFAGAFSPPNDANLVENLDYLYSFYESDYYAEIYLHLWMMWEAVSDGPFMQFSDVGTWSKFGVWTLKQDLSPGMIPVHQVVNWLSRNRTQWWT